MKGWKATNIFSTSLIYYQILWKIEIAVYQVSWLPWLQALKFENLFSKCLSIIPFFYYCCDGTMNYIHPSLMTITLRIFSISYQYTRYSVNELNRNIYKSIRFRPRTADVLHIFSTDSFTCIVFDSILYHLPAYHI